MESMQLTARVMIEQNRPHMTAFSALPNAPVLPARDRRRPVRRTLEALNRRIAGLAARRTTVRRQHLAA